MLFAEAFSEVRSLQYFLGIEIARSKRGIILSQRKYVLDILFKASLLRCRAADAPMESNVKLLPDHGEILDDPDRYHRSVGKLNYLMITRLDITFVVSIESVSLSTKNNSLRCSSADSQALKEGYGQTVSVFELWTQTKIVSFSDTDWAGSLIDRRSTTDYYVFLRANFMPSKSKKQSGVSI